MLFQRNNVGIPTISDHCDVHVRTNDCAMHKGRVAWVAIYDRTRERWHVGGEAGSTALYAALTFAGVSQRARAAAVRE